MSKKYSPVTAAEKQHKEQIIAFFEKTITASEGREYTIKDAQESIKKTLNQHPHWNGMKAGNVKLFWSNNDQFLQGEIFGGGKGWYIEDETHTWKLQTTF